jgi:hypothetical protein
MNGTMTVPGTATYLKSAEVKVIQVLISDASSCGHQA